MVKEGKINPKDNGNQRVPWDAATHTTVEELDENGEYIVKGTVEIRREFATPITLTINRLIHGDVVVILNEEPCGDDQEKKTEDFHQLSLEKRFFPPDETQVYIPANSGFPCGRIIIWKPSGE
jgi:hypothetical protein